MGILLVQEIQTNKDSFKEKDKKQHDV